MNSSYSDTGGARLLYMQLLTGFWSSLDMSSSFGKDFLPIQYYEKTHLDRIER